jgi:hypothetical protein
MNPKQLPPNIPQGMLLNPKQQHPDEFFSGPAVTVSGWAPIPMDNGSVRIAFCEKVFSDGKAHFRTAVTLDRIGFIAFVDSMVKFKNQLVSEDKHDDKHNAA